MARVYYSYKTNTANTVKDKPTPYPESILFRCEDGTAIRVYSYGDHDYGVTDNVSDGRMKGIALEAEDKDGKEILEFLDEEEIETEEEKEAYFSTLSKLGEEKTKIESIDIYCEDEFNVPEGEEPTCSDLEVDIQYYDEKDDEVTITKKAEGSVTVGR